MAGNGPDYAVYTVVERGGSEDENFWIRCGSAWWHKDKAGLNITLDALPVNGRLVLRDPSSDKGSNRR